LKIYKSEYCLSHLPSPFLKIMRTRSPSSSEFSNTKFSGRILEFITLHCSTLTKKARKKLLKKFYLLYQVNRSSGGGEGSRVSVSLTTICTDEGILGQLIFHSCPTMPLKYRVHTLCPPFNGSRDQLIEHTACDMIVKGTNFLSFKIAFQALL